jgi:hypothetical protein
MKHWHYKRQRAGRKTVWQCECMIGCMCHVEMCIRTQWQMTGCIRKFSYHEIFCSLCQSIFLIKHLRFPIHVSHAIVHPPLVSKSCAPRFCHVRTSPVSLVMCLFQQYWRIKRRVSFGALYISLHDEQRRIYLKNPCEYINYTPPRLVLFHLPPQVCLYEK